MGFKKQINRVIRFLLNRRETVSTEELLSRIVQATIESYRSSGLKIGTNCYIHGVNMGHGEPIEIGDNCILTYCTILGHDAAPAAFIPELQRGGLMDRISKKKLTTIKDGCFIGANATILCGVTVGPNSIVGAGAVVTKDVPPDTVVVGNPARVLCTIEEFVEKHRSEMAAHPEHYPAHT